MYCTDIFAMYEQHMVNIFYLPCVHNIYFIKMIICGTHIDSVWCTYDRCFMDVLGIDK